MTAELAEGVPSGSTLPKQQHHEVCASLLAIVVCCNFLAHCTLARRNVCNSQRIARRQFWRLAGNYAPPSGSWGQLAARVDSGSCVWHCGGRLAGVSGDSRGFWLAGAILAARAFPTQRGIVSNRLVSQSPSALGTLRACHSEFLRQWGQLLGLA